MTRLYNELLAARGGLTDSLVLGAFTEFGGYLEQAQCFEISEPIANICAEVSRSRPSSILSALDMIRAPFPYTWIEWSSVRPYSTPNDKPVPQKLGCLLKTNKEGSKGYFMFSWIHGPPDPGITINPLGLIFDWDTKSTEPVIVQFADARGMRAEAEEAATRKRESFRDNSIKAGSRWERYSKIPQERDAVLELEMRAELIPVDCFAEFLTRTKLVPGHPIYEGYASDLNGELAFIEAFLLLLNSRNSIIDQKRDDFSRLNKARAKNRRPPLKEFITTQIKLNRVQANRLGGHHDREAARAHMVRGHFKVKGSGVWWWSPHMRGTGTPVARDYKVV